MGNEQCGLDTDLSGMASDIADVVGSISEMTIDKDGVESMVLGFSKMVENGSMGDGVHYICPKCKGECWANEAFAGAMCWECTTGSKKGASFFSRIGNKNMQETNPDFFNRLSRYSTMANGHLERPVTTLKQSNYLKLYDKLIRTKPQFDEQDILTVLIMLETHPNYAKEMEKQKGKMLTKYENIPKVCNSIPKKCVYLWSIESPLYRHLCSILEMDDYFELQQFMPLIRCLNLFIVSHPTSKALTTYRGSHMVKKQFDNLNMNQYYRIPKFLATSQDEAVARNFKSEEGIIVTFQIDKGCYNAACIAQYSELGQKESEVLLPPYTVIKVTGMDKGNRRMTVHVMDNKATGMDTPQIHL